MNIRPVIIAAMVSSITLAGCMQPMDNPNNATQGAVTGAMIGGIIGLSRGGDDKVGKAAVGAAIGGIIGNAIGAKLDAQAADLRQDLGNDDVTIVNTGSELIVTMPQDILFATDSAVVRSGLQMDLRTLASNLQAYPDTSVEVIGHTDNTGSASYNYDLSSRRASAVATILTSNGVGYDRIVAIGRGEDIPVATNLTPEGRAQNRRVEIVITPNS